MTEREFFFESIPEIAEIAVSCEKMSEEEYEAFKVGWLSTTPATARDFANRILIVIDTAIGRKEIA